MKTAKSTKIHRAGLDKEITELMKGKTSHEGFREYRDIVERNYDLDLTVRQLQYFFNTYVFPKRVVPPAESKKAIDERRKMIDVIVEQMDIYDEHKQKLAILFSMDPLELQREANDNLLEGDRRNSELDIRGKLASITRKEIRLAMDTLECIKELKQELGLLHKEPERLQIESKTESGFKLADLDKETVKELALALAKQ